MFNHCCRNNNGYPADYPYYADESFAGDGYYPGRYDGYYNRHDNGYPNGSLFIEDNRCGCGCRSNHTHDYEKVYVYEHHHDSDNNRYRRGYYR